MENEKVNYNVLIIEDYNDNKGEPESVEVIKCDDLEEAMINFESEASETNSKHGTFTRVELWADDEIIKEGVQESELIPEGSIIVTYNHERYMNYAYNILAVRYAREGERHEDLHVSEDRIWRPWDQVFTDLSELTNSYEDGDGIFEKIHKGRSVIESFLYK